ncbi:MAG: hypothetical protein AAGA77_08160 [Bacteroidota bacterium]
MKYTTYYICFILTLASCASEKAWYDQTERFKVSNKTANFFSPNTEESSYPIDSNLYLKLLDSGSSEFCAMISAFTMSEVKMKRDLPNRCHKQMFHFEHCSASILEDTVNIIFRTQNPRKSMASNKIMKVRLLGNDHNTEIIHWGEESQEITHRDGSTSVRKSPTSKIIKTKLKLNQKAFELGDTIIGEIKVTSVQYKGRRKIKVKEEASGKFRAIVGGYNLDCNLNESLAHSWLK